MRLGLEVISGCGRDFGGWLIISVYHRRPRIATVSSPVHLRQRCIATPRDLGYDTAP